MGCVGHTRMKQLTLPLPSVWKPYDGLICTFLIPLLGGVRLVQGPTGGQQAGRVWSSAEVHPAALAIWPAGHCSAASCRLPGDAWYSKVRQR